MEKVLDAVERATGHPPFKKGKEWHCRCPAHDDREPSLNVTEGQGGTVLLQCRSHGCKATDVVRAVGLEVRDLFPESVEPAKLPVSERVIATYDYRDENGTLLCQAVRLFPKDFRQRRPDGKGGWVWNLEGTRRVPYRLPDLLRLKPGALVVVVEGEKDADRLWAAGIAATTNPMGAGKWDKLDPEAARLALSGRRVVIVPDNDDAGREHARQVRESVASLGCPFAVMALPGVGAKGDVSDWLDSGGTADGFRLLLAEALPPPWPTPRPISQMRQRQGELNWLWDGYIGAGEVTLLSSIWKTGKTTLLAHLFRAMEFGGEFCGRRVSPARVCVISEEPEHLWADRRDKLGLHDHLWVLPRPFFGLPRKEEWESFVAWMTDVVEAETFDLVVVDALSGCWPVRDENSNAQIQEALMPLRRISQVASLLLLHHLRKTDGGEFTGSRGGGALPAFVETMVELRPLIPGDDDDRRRVLRAKGRWDDTPRELVVELSEDGAEYRACGSRSEMAQRELSDSILELLGTGSRFAVEGMLADWPDDEKPSRKKLTDVLNQGVMDGRWRRVGEGKRSDPYMYYLPDSGVPSDG
jgi:hypothetical protein